MCLCRKTNFHHWLASTTWEFSLCRWQQIVFTILNMEGLSNSTLSHESLVVIQLLSVDLNAKSEQYLCERVGKTNFTSQAYLCLFPISNYECSRSRWFKPSNILKFSQIFGWQFHFVKEWGRAKFVIQHTKKKFSLISALIVFVLTKFDSFYWIHFDQGSNRRPFQIWNW